MQSVKDPKCKAWEMKLNETKTVDPASIIDKAPIGLQMASEMVSLKPEEMFKMLEEDLTRKTPEQVEHVKTAIKNLCKSQALAHRHAANSADYLAELTDMISLPATIKIMNATLRLVVAVNIPEVDDSDQESKGGNIRSETDRPSDICAELS